MRILSLIIVSLLCSANIWAQSSSIIIEDKGCCCHKVTKVTERVTGSDTTSVTLCGDVSVEQCGTQQFQLEDQFGKKVKIECTDIVLYNDEPPVYTECELFLNEVFCCSDGGDGGGSEPADVDFTPLLDFYQDDSLHIYGNVQIDDTLSVELINELYVSDTTAVACLDSIKTLLNDTLNIALPDTFQVDVVNDSLEVHVLNFPEPLDTVHVIQTDTIDVSVVNDSLEVHVLNFPEPLDTVHVIQTDTVDISVVNDSLEVHVLNFPEPLDTVHVIQTDTVDVSVVNDSLEVHVLNFPEPLDTVHVIQTDTVDVNVVNDLYVTDTTAIACLDSLKGLLQDTLLVAQVDTIIDTDYQIVEQCYRVQSSSIGGTSVGDHITLFTQVELSTGNPVLTFQQWQNVSTATDVSSDVTAGNITLISCEDYHEPVGINGQNQYFISTTNGVIAAGFYSYSICNIGDADGTVNDGINGNQIVKPTQCFQFTAYLNPVTNEFIENTALGWDANGTEFSITIKE